MWKESSSAALRARRAHKASLTACVRVSSENEGVHQEIREFAATTRGLLLLRDWLASFEIELVGMEATGVYSGSRSTTCWRTTSNCGF
jgi:hypothetical protein